jgi:hypothetical protein
MSHEGLEIPLGPAVNREFLFYKCESHSFFFSQIFAYLRNV